MRHSWSRRRLPSLAKLDKNGLILNSIKMAPLWHGTSVALGTLELSRQACHGAGSFGRRFDRTLGASLSIVSLLAVLAVNRAGRAKRSQVLIIVPSAGAVCDK